MRTGHFLYRRAAPWQKFLKADGVAFYVFVLARSHSGLDLPQRYAKQVKSVPKELDKELSGEDKVAAEEAADNGELWYVKVNGDGWMWNQPNGDSRVADLHQVLKWLEKIESKPGSTKIFYAEVTNNFITARTARVAARYPTYDVDFDTPGLTREQLGDAFGGIYDKILDGLSSVIKPYRRKFSKQATRAEIEFHHSDFKQLVGLMKQILNDSFPGKFKLRNAYKGEYVWVWRSEVARKTVVVEVMHVGNTKGENKVYMYVGV